MSAFVVPWYHWLVVGVIVGIAMTGGVVRLVGRESHERRGVIRFDTPRARSALRRCNPARDVHYFGGQARCECGEVVYGELPPRVMRTVEGVPPEVFDR